MWSKQVKQTEIMRWERCGSQEYNQGVVRGHHWAMGKETGPWAWLDWERNGNAAFQSTFCDLFLLDLSLCYQLSLFFFIFNAFLIFFFLKREIDSDLWKLFLLRENVKSLGALITIKILEVSNSFVMWMYVPLRREKIVFSRKEIVS